MASLALTNDPANEKSRSTSAIANVNESTAIVLQSRLQAGGHSTVWSQGRASLHSARDCGNFIAVPCQSQSRLRLIAARERSASTPRREVRSDTANVSAYWSTRNESPPWTCLPAPLSDRSGSISRIRCDDLNDRDVSTENLRASALTAPCVATPDAHGADADRRAQVPAKWVRGFAVAEGLGEAGMPVSPLVVRRRRGRRASVCASVDAAQR